MPPTIPQYFTSERIALFWSRVDRSGEHWLWLGALNGHGYGNTWSFSTYTLYSHRVAWVLATGEDPSPKHVLHTCDVRNCVRNDDIGIYSVLGVEYPRRGHLFLGDCSANMKDRGQKHRGRGNTREKIAVDSEIATEIRNLYYFEEWTKLQLAWQFNASVLTIQDVINYGL
jgi:hypothetical protein